MTDRVIGEVMIGDNLWQRNGGVLGEPGHDADLIFGLDVGKVIACGAKDKLIVTARQLDGRKSDEINKNVTALSSLDFRWQSLEAGAKFAKVC